MMRDNDCGAVPVIDNGCIVGIVTDRDLVVRALASGTGVDAKVGDVIARDPCCCASDDDLREAERVEHISAPRRQSFDYGAHANAEQRF